MNAAMAPAPWAAGDREVLGGAKRQRRNQTPETQLAGDGIPARAKVERRLRYLRPDALLGWQVLKGNGTL